MSREEVDDVVAGAVQALGGVGHLAVDLLLPPAQQARVGDVLHECVMKGEMPITVVRQGIEKTCFYERLDRRFEIRRIVHNRA